MDRQLLAKLGVFVLLGVNVAAYYVFWPHQNEGGKSDVKAAQEEKGEVKLLPTQPKDLPPKSLVKAIPLSMPAPPKLPEYKAATQDELVEKLLSRIKEQGDAANDKPPATLILSPKPNWFDDKKILAPELPRPDDGKPKPLPPLTGEPLLPAGGKSSVGVTSPLTPKEPTGPWTVRTEKIGKQTLLIAKLREPAAGQTVEFRILCDRTSDELIFPLQSVVAHGNVAFAGGGLQGTCDRVTLSMDAAKLVFANQVSITLDGSAGANLRGDWIVWERPENKRNPVKTRPVLGAPK